MGHRQHRIFLRLRGFLFPGALFLFSGLICPAFATIEVAFLQLRDVHGKLIRLESGGAGFFHVAIKFQGQWLHSHPRGGVQISNSLHEFGELVVILEDKNLQEPGAQEVAHYIGRPYDPFFLWGGNNLYCSELVGLLLNIEPRPMKFSGSFWKQYFRKLRMKLPQGVGVSPDFIYLVLLERGFVAKTENLNCKSDLE